MLNLNTVICLINLRCNLSKSTVNIFFLISSLWHTSGLSKYKSVGLNRVYNTAGIWRVFVSKWMWFYAYHKLIHKEITIYEFQFKLYIKWLNYFNVQGRKKNCYSNSSLERVIFAPWKSCIKCYRKWRFLMRKFLVLLILQQATWGHDFLGPEMVHKIQFSW